MAPVIGIDTRLAPGLSFEGLASIQRASRILLPLSRVSSARPWADAGICTSAVSPTWYSFLSEDSMSTLAAGPDWSRASPAQLGQSVENTRPVHWQPSRAQ